MYIRNNKKGNQTTENGNNSEKDTTYGGFHNGTLPFRPSMWAEPATIQSYKTTPPKVGRDDSNGVKELERHLLADCKIASSICDEWKLLEILCGGMELQRTGCMVPKPT